MLRENCRRFTNRGIRLQAFSLPHRTSPFCGSSLGFLSSSHLVQEGQAFLADSLRSALEPPLRQLYGSKPVPLTALHTHSHLHSLANMSTCALHNGTAVVCLSGSDPQYCFLLLDGVLIKKPGCLSMYCSHK